MYALVFDEPERINDEMRRYEAVGAEEVRTFAADYLGSDNRVVLTYVPAEGAVAADEAEAAEAAEAAAAETTTPGSAA
jgi:hypothetical protein